MIEIVLIAIGFGLGYVSDKWIKKCKEEYHERTKHWYQS